MTVGSPHVPVVPAMIPAAEDLVQDGTRPREPDGGARHVASRLAETNHLGVRHNLANEFSHFDFERVDEGKCDSVLQLPAYCRVDRVMAVTKDDRTYPHLPVDVFVAIHVPDVRPLAAREVYRRNPANVLPGPLGKRLRKRGHEVLRARQPALALRDGRIILVKSDRVRHEVLGDTHSRRT